jgi:hypothetical protein
MTVKDILVTKKDLVNEYNQELDNILLVTAKLMDDQRENLPKFGSEFEEEKLKSYIENLDKASKDPIRFKRKEILSKLKIGVQKMNEEFFDDDHLDEIIVVLTNLSTIGEWYDIIANNVSASILQETFIKILTHLTRIQTETTMITSTLDQLKVGETKRCLFREYIAETRDMDGIQDACSKIVKIENDLGLEVIKDELNLVDDVFGLLGVLEPYGKPFTESLTDLKHTKERIEKTIEQFNNKYRSTIKEIEYWKLLNDIYIPGTRNLKVLEEKLDEIRTACKASYKSFSLIEQIYTNDLQQGINIKEIAAQIETIYHYVNHITIGNVKDIETINKWFEYKGKLENIGYPNIETILSTYEYSKIEDFFSRTLAIMEKYENLQKEYQLYCKILEKQIVIPVNYTELLKSVDECKNALIKEIGKDFEVLIEYIKSEAEDINVNQKTLEKFIKRTRPLIREVLRL